MMFLNMSYFMMINLALLFISTNYPLPLSLIILAQTTIIAVIMYNMNIVSWYAYMLLMVFLSGMMVIFIYVSCLSSTKIITTGFLPRTHLLLMNSFMGMYLIMYNQPLSPMTPQLNNLMFSTNWLASLLTHKIFSPSIFLISVLMIIYLLLVLITIVKLTNITQGPMQS